jgi:hypothetical protein
LNKTAKDVSANANKAIDQFDQKVTEVSCLDQKMNKEYPSPMLEQV